MNPIQKIQADAMKESLQAKRDFEIAEQTRKVDALADQVAQRLRRLGDLAADVRFDCSRAGETPVNYAAGVFGHDTKTIDKLLVMLTEESAALDTMRTAKATTDEMTSRFEALIDQAAEQMAEPQPEAQVFEMPTPTAGAYL